MNKSSDCPNCLWTNNFKGFQDGSAGAARADHERTCKPHSHVWETVETGHGREVLVCQCGARRHVEV